MSSHDILIACRRCRKESPMRDMKYDPNGRDLVCNVCALESSEEIAVYSDTDDGEIPTKKKRSQKSSQVAKDDPRSRYYCVSCKYTFSRNKDIAVELCPYCSKPTVKKYTAKSSDELLQEAHSPFD